MLSKLQQVVFSFQKIGANSSLDIGFPPWFIGFVRLQYYSKHTRIQKKLKSCILKKYRIYMAYHCICDLHFVFINYAG